MFAFATSVCTDELPLTVRFAAGVSASPTVKPIVLEGVSSLVTCAATLAIVGALLVPGACTWKPALGLTYSPLTVTGIVAVHPRPAAAAGATVRSAPVSPRTMLAPGGPD